jgi:L-iditol 2-dehydrogenase
VESLNKGVSMKAALLYGIDDLRVVDVDQPEAGDEDIIVRVQACAVCPTDVRKYRTGDHSSLQYPVNVGHEWAGDVVEVGCRVHDFARGMRVAGTARGGYAELLRFDTLSSRPQALVPIPDEMTYEQATFIEPLADCIHSLRDQARTGPSDNVVILGGGQMALLHVIVAKLAGARVIVSEPMRSRRNLATEFGADAVVDPAQENAATRVRQETAGRGANAVIVSVGLASLVETALEMVAPRGRIVLFGGFANQTSVSFDPNIIHYNELCLVGSEWVGARGFEDLTLYYQAIALIASGQAPVDRLVTARFPLQNIWEAFSMVERHEGLKAIIIPHAPGPSAGL